jgi:mRNA interferase RelE/StbE
LTTYRLTFLRDAEKEWKKLDKTVQTQFAKKLRERLGIPRVPSARLHDMPDCYKIKLRKVGYRLVYRVFNDRIVVQVVAVGKRERNEAYAAAARRI